MAKMLALDVGNTNLVVGLYDNDHLLQSFRLFTDRTRTVDEYGVLLKKMLLDHEHDPREVEGVCVSNVVPILTDRIEQVCRKYLRLEPLFVRTHLDLGLTVVVERPEEVGADLLAAMVAARQRFGAPVAVADLGTATTISFLTDHGCFRGVIIAPGLEISMEAVLSRAPHLPPFRLEAPPQAHGTNTIHCLQSGLLLGHACMIDGLVERVEQELGPTQLVATGGLAPLVGTVSRRITTVEPNLILEGIRQIWTRNRA